MGEKLLSAETTEQMVVKALVDCMIKHKGLYETSDAVLDALHSIPAVDATPVVHGRWRQDDEDAWTCTACGNIWTFLDGGPNENNAKYCPVCGAKMNLEEKPNGK